MGLNGRGLPAPALLIVLLYLFLATGLKLYSVAVAKEGVVVELSLRLTSIGDNGFEALVNATSSEFSYKCRGVIEKNLYYRETRAISSNLIVLPLYYILDHTCPRLLTLLASLEEGGVASITITVPRGYRVVSALDTRGYGGLGDYLVPVAMLSRHYLYDSIVVYSTRSYESLVFNKTLITIYPRNASLALVKAVSVTVLAVKGFLEKELGESPREPVVLVIARQGEHPYSGGFHYSTGSIIYLSLGGEQEVVDLVHAAAHETVHGWFNHGLIWGTDYLVSEGATEYLALLALHSTVPEVARTIDERIVSLYISAKSRYGIGLLANAGLRQAALVLCGEDAYTKALRDLFRESLSKPIQGLQPISFEDVVEMTTNRCGNETGRKILAVAAPMLLVKTLSGRIGSGEWPYVDRENVANTIRQIAAVCRVLGERGGGAKTSATETGGENNTGEGTTSTSRVYGVNTSRATPLRGSGSGESPGKPLILPSLVALILLVAYGVYASRREVQKRWENRV